MTAAIVATPPIAVAVHRRDQRHLGLRPGGHVTVNGNGNNVTWKNAKTGTKPKVQNNGTRNAVANSKAAPASKKQ